MGSSNRWRMTARARVLGGVAVGAYAGMCIALVPWSDWRYVLYGFVVIGWVIGWVIVSGGFWLQASRRSRESPSDFAVRVLREHGIDATACTESHAPQHVTYVVDVDTFRRIKEHEFLSEGAVRTGGET